MKGVLILVTFFSLFFVASLLLGSSMFPGSFFSALLLHEASQYVVYLSALFNGIIYGLTLWAVFLAIGRRFE